MVVPGSHRLSFHNHFHHFHHFHRFHRFQTDRDFIWLGELNLILQPSVLSIPFHLQNLFHIISNVFRAAPRRFYNYPRPGRKMDCKLWRLQRRLISIEIKSSPTFPTLGSSSDGHIHNVLRESSISFSRCEFCKEDTDRAH